MPAPLAGAITYGLGLDTAVFATGINQGLQLLGQFRAAAAKPFTIIGREWQEASGLSDLALQLRVSAKELAQLSAAADVAAGSSSGIFGMFRFMRRALADASVGGTETTRAFKAMGLEIEQLTRMGGTQQLLTILEAMLTLDEASQTYAAQSIFGRSISDVLLLANKTEQVRQVMERFGPAADIQASMAARANEMLDHWKEIGLEIKTIATALAAELLPVVKSIVDQLNQIKLGEKIAGVHSFVEWSKGVLKRLPELVLSIGDRASYDRIMGLILSEMKPLPAPAPLPPAGTRTLPPNEERAAAASTARPSVDEFTRIGAFLYGASGAAGAAQAAQRTAKSTEQIAITSKITAEQMTKLLPDVQAMVDFVRQFDFHG